MVSNKLLRHGVTSYCPTLISCEANTYKKILPFFVEYMIQQQPQRLQSHSPSSCPKPKARVLGMHLEGPFFEPTKRGAHSFSCIHDPKDGIHSLEQIYGSEILYDAKERIKGLPGIVRIVTLAPERPGALIAIRELIQKDRKIKPSIMDHDHVDKKRKKTNPINIVVSCGHSNATLEQGQQAVMNGASLITHLFNAMRPFHRKFFY